MTTLTWGSLGWRVAVLLRYQWRRVSIVARRRWRVVMLHGHPTAKQRDMLRIQSAYIEAKNRITSEPGRVIVARRTGGSILDPRVREAGGWMDHATQEVVVRKNVFNARTEQRMPLEDLPVYRHWS